MFVGDKRRNILMLLGDQDMTIGDVVDKFDITRAAVKKHLKILEEGKLISVHAWGRERINRLEPMVFQAATVWSFLTEKDKLAQWFHSPESDLEEGKEYTLARKNRGEAYSPRRRTQKFFELTRFYGSVICCPTFST